MRKLLAKILGVILLLAGVAVGIVHYVVEGNSTQSWLTLAGAALLLVVGWTFFDWGAGISSRRGSGRE
jgi:hypothetical protein